MLSSEYAERPGTLRFLEVESELLRGNRYGDPTLRRHPVYLPPDYAASESRRYPVVLVLIGYTGLAMHAFAPGTFSEMLHQRLDRLIGAGMPPLIAVSVDAYNRLGGSQYRNGASGPYEDHIVEELLPAIRRELRTNSEQFGFGVVGKSSGGYGALHLGMQHPRLFPAVASHSGDAGFEHSIWPALPQCIGVFDRHPGDEDAMIESFLEAFWSSPQPSYDEGHALMMLACAAAYAPDPEAPHGFRLPFDPRSGERRPEIWERWLAADPLRRVAESADALRSLRLLYFDCGNRDQYGLHLGARQLKRELDRHGIAHEYEEFDGTHSGLQYRYDFSFPKLVAALGGETA